MARQGPHHGAQKSTTTGMSFRVRWRSKLSVVTAKRLALEQRPMAGSALRPLGRPVGRDPIDRQAVRADEVQR